MRLRLRLVLTTLGTALPLLTALLFGYRSFSQRSFDELITAVALAQSPADTCPDKAEVRLVRVPHLGRSPWSRHAAAFELRWADRTGKTHQGQTSVPAALLDDLRRGISVAARHITRDSAAFRELLIPLPDRPDACALAWVVAPELHRPLPPLPVLLWPIVLALIAVLVGIAPVVRRTRALTLAVRHWRADTTRIPPAESAGDELGELSRAFHVAAETMALQQTQLAARERDVREFVENVSHDLATPLTVLKGHLSALAERPDPDLIRQAMNEAQYLGALFGSLAVTAKFEAGGVVQTSLDLRDVVLRVVERHRSMAARLDISLESFSPDEPVLATGDPTFAEQAITNLLGNALRYNQVGGHVAVVLDVVRDGFSLRVLDDGPGLSDEDRAKVLQRGVRGDDARSREPAGRGLGLSIVARVAAVHGWQFALSPGNPRGLVAELTGLRLAASGDPSA